MPLSDRRHVSQVCQHKLNLHRTIWDSCHCGYHLPIYCLTTRGCGQHGLLLLSLQRLLPFTFDIFPLPSSHPSSPHALLATSHRNVCSWLRGCDGCISWWEGGGVRRWWRVVPGRALNGIPQLGCNAETSSRCHCSPVLWRRCGCKE